MAAGFSPRLDNFSIIDVLLSYKRFFNSSNNSADQSPPNLLYACFCADSSFGSIISSKYQTTIFFNVFNKNKDRLIGLKSLVTIFDNSPVLGLKTTYMSLHLTSDIRLRQLIGLKSLVADYTFSTYACCLANKSQSSFPISSTETNIDLKGHVRYFSRLGNKDDPRATLPHLYTFHINTTRSVMSCSSAGIVLSDPGD